jgi:heptosyltransferase-2
LAGIRIRIGYNVEQRGIFLTHALDYNSSLREKHMVENYLDILRAIGVEPERKELVLNIDSKTQIKVEEIMQKKGIMLEDLVIGIAPGAIYGEAKRWPKERFIELADTLIEKYNAKILIFTGPMEKELGYEIKKMMKNSPLTFNGDNPLLETAALIKRCNLFITNDSGLMHVAAAVKTKIIAIFGSTSPEWTKPYGDGHIIIRKTIDCSPCFKRKCRYRTYDCLNSITVSDILEVIDIYKRENINKSLLKNYNRKHLFFYKTLKRCY